MDDESANGETLPLIKIKTANHSLKFKNHFLATPIKLILKFSMWVIFISWVSMIFIYPSQFFNHWYRSAIRASWGTIYGASGISFLLFSAPILVIAFLATAHLSLSGEEEIQEKKASKKPRFRLWTFPIFVDGPLGVVSAAELIGIVLFYVFIVWFIYAHALKNLSRSGFQLTHKQGWYLVLGQFGRSLGLIGLFCLAFLFLPVARGSMLLRLIDIPFEHAARYHVWLGHLTMLIFTLHGLCFVIPWAMQGRLIEELLYAKIVHISNLAGLVSLLAGLLMWVTSWKPVRRERFELFFYTHQLYVVFVVFMSLHVGDSLLCYAAGGIFLFILDRLLRFCQSRRVVNVISVTCLPCGTVELVVSKPKNLKYNALSFIFLQVRELAFLQWHPFSVSSSALEGNHIAVIIKGLGGWTKKLRERILNGHDDQSQVEKPLKSHPNMTVSVEGPYGHESPYHLAYEHLILVAGGIGISPFLAILSDILHRVKEGKPCLPKNILILWAVKKSDELPLLYGFDMESVCPFYSDTLNVEIRTFVTRESEPRLIQEEGKITMRMNSIDNRSGVSVLVGTGHIIWSGMYVMVSTIGLVISVGLLNVYYINPYRITLWWYKGLLLMVCMVLSPLIFGGAVIGLWYFWEKISLREDECKSFEPNIEIRTGNARREDMEVSAGRVVDTQSILYGRRPDFEEIFGSIGRRWGHVDIGVIVCGPPTLQTSVAKECRSQNLRKRKGDFPIFHFNSHSFDL